VSVRNKTGNKLNRIGGGRVIDHQVRYVTLSFQIVPRDEYTPSVSKTAMAEEYYVVRTWHAIDVIVINPANYFQNVLPRPRYMAKGNIDTGSVSRTTQFHPLIQP
jgi:hypothetical protein